MSLKLALERLGLGPCHHMEEVMAHLPEQVPLWIRAAGGAPDWAAIYQGYRSAVDWPTAGFVAELARVYPDAKVVLTVRDPEAWAGSFGETIGKFLAAADQLPPEMEPWLRMGRAVLGRTGFPAGLDRSGLIAALNAHTEFVRRTVPANRLLILDVREGWAPLCDFLGEPVPAEPFPRTNGSCPSTWWNLRCN